MMVKIQEYCYKKGINRLIQLDITEVKESYIDTLIHEFQILNYDYWKTLPSKSLGVVKVPIKDVIGTWHIDYANRKWIENLGNLKRFREDYTKESVLKYLSNLKEETDIRFNKYGEKYIIKEGNHRTHFAKFLDLPFIYARVEEHYFDIDFLDLINEYKNKGLVLKWPSKNIYRNSSWILVLKNYDIYIHNFENLKAIIDIYKQTKFSNVRYKTLRLLWLNFNKEKERQFFHVNSINESKAELVKAFKEHKINV